MGFGWCRIFFFKQKTAYEMRISDWSSDVCSSDLGEEYRRGEGDIDGIADEARVTQQHAEAAEHRQRPSAAAAVMVRLVQQQPGEDEHGRAHRQHGEEGRAPAEPDRKSTRLNSSH